MKLLVFISLLIAGSSATAQKIPEYGLNRVRVIDSGKTIQADLMLSGSGPKTKADKFYYWYSNNAIHHSEGGFSGRLLDGQYLEFYPDNNLKVQGSFKKGLKCGSWKNWDDNGVLLEATKWRNGIPLPDAVPPLWKRLHFLKGKKKTLKSSATKKNSVP